MSRRRTRKDEVRVYENAPVPPDPKEAAPEPPEAFKRLFSTAIAHKRNTRGRVGLYAPLYVPPGVQIAFFLAPTGTAGVADFNSAKLAGWKPLPPELATTDEDDAINNNKVALLYFDVVDGLVRVGEHAVMVRAAREWYEDYARDIRDLEDIKRYQALGVRVEEQTSKEEEYRLPET